MKTLLHAHRRAVLLGPILPLIAFAATMSSPSFGATDAFVSEPKTHTLFMGADIDLKLDNEFCRVRDVEGDAFVVSGKGTERSVPMNKGLLDMKVEQSLKLTEASATIVDLKSDRVYTDANDPRKKFMRAQPGTAGADAFGSSAGVAGTAQIMDGAALNFPDSADPASAAKIRAAAQADIANAGRSANSAANSDSFSEGNNIGNYVAKMQQELDKELFDAMDVTFAVSSAKPLERPYVVIVARYHEKDVRPVKYHNWISAKGLPRIDGKPERVHVMQGGFPPGFVMDDFKIHLFDRGQEIATNVAEKRVELTYQDAFKYVMIDYMIAHKGASLPAAPIMGQLPADWHTHLTPEQLTKPYFIKVSKDGMPLGAYADEACSQSVSDPYLQSIVRDIRFTPALNKGRAVEGTTKLRFGEIRI
jgi:hypothetical protein